MSAQVCWHADHTRLGELMAPYSNRSGRTRVIGVWSTLALALLFVSACTSPPAARWQTQDEAAAAVRAEIRGILPRLGTDVTDYQEGLGVCGAMHDGSHLQVMISLRFTPDEALVARMPSGYLAEKKAQGWSVMDHSMDGTTRWSIAERDGVSLRYSIFPGKAGSISGSGPCLPKSAGELTTQGWTG